MSQPKKVLITTSSFAEKDRAPLEMLIQAGYEVIDNPFKRKLTKPESMELLKEDVVGLIAGLETLDREVLSHSSLKVVSRVGSGISNVDLEAAASLGIAVRSTPNGPTEAVAELTLCMMLSVLRMAPQMNAALQAGNWFKKTGAELAGKTVAIIGFGRIGQRVAELLAPFRVQLLVVDPYFRGQLPTDCQKVALDEALAQAHLISLHASGETCLLGEDAFAKMRQGVFIFNVARGGLVSEEQLVNHLDSGKVAGAWVDAFTQEPYQGPLCGRPNVLLTPHVGSYTTECRLGMEREAVSNLLAALGNA